MNEITKEQFEAYLNLQKAGTCNMLNPMVRDICDLTTHEHISIIKNYDNLKLKFTN
jgi:phosphoenolpyruvate-protein kinase (PTS system EI component)